MSRHLKNLFVGGAVLAGSAYGYKRLKGAAPSVPPNTPPMPAPAPTPAPPPPNYNPGTLSGPHPGDTNGIVTYNPAASVTDSSNDTGGLATNAGIDVSSDGSL